MKLTVNTILAGRWFSAGDEIPKEIVPPGLRRYATKEAKPPTAEPTEVNLRRDYNQAYSVDADGFMRAPVRRQMAEMQAEAEETDAIEDDIAEAPLNETVVSALEQAQDEYQADVQRQIGNARYVAESADEVEDAVRAKQDANVDDSGECDVEEPKPKPQIGRKLFVKRKGQFVPAAAAVDLVRGESLFRFRPRSMGVSAKYIKHSVYE